MVIGNVLSVTSHPTGGIDAAVDIPDQTASGVHHLAWEKCVVWTWACTVPCGGSSACGRFGAVSAG